MLGLQVDKEKEEKEVPQRGKHQEPKEALADKKQNKTKEQPLLNII